jgi:hypothetical protein
MIGDTLKIIIIIDLIKTGGHPKGTLIPVLIRLFVTTIFSCLLRSCLASPPHQCGNRKTWNRLLKI